MHLRCAFRLPILQTYFEYQDQEEITCIKYPSIIFCKKRKAFIKLYDQYIGKNKHYQLDGFGHIIDAYFSLRKHVYVKCPQKCEELCQVLQIMNIINIKLILISKISKWTFLGFAHPCTSLFILNQCEQIYKSSSSKLSDITKSNTFN